jgi:NAD(P)-dependent dehydrogenase (short-subunit alcohol dehydrogenase family)
VRRKIVVTGAGRGIGKEIAQRVSEKGDVAIIIDKDADQAKETEALIKASGLAAAAYSADLTAPDQVARVFQAIYKDSGPIDVLINNAGYYLPKPIEEIDVDFWNLVIDANLKTAFLCSLEVFRQMKTANYGKIVNIASSTVFTSGAGLCPYITAKSGLIGLTRALAVDLAPYGIRVNAIAAGLTATDYAYEAFGETKFDKVKELRAIKRDQLPIDLMGAVAFFMDPSSDFITGQTLIVDGGRAFI